MSSTQSGDALNNDIDLDTEDAFSSLWGLDAEGRPSKDTKDEPEEDQEQEEPAEDNEDTNDEADEGEESSDEDSPDDEDADESDEDGENEDQQTIEVKDDHKFKVKVDGVEQEFTLGSLKRLAGQEASLTNKSKEVAEKRKQVDQAAATQLAVLKVMRDRAEKRFKDNFGNVDLMVAAKDPNVTAEELVAVRNAMQAAQEDVAFFDTELGNFAQALRHQQKLELQEQAKEAIKVLSDPEKGIEGWNEKLYGEIRSFAIDSGIDKEVIDNLVDPAAIKLINMARLYAKGKTKVQSDKSDKKKAPKRIVKSTATAEATKKIVKTAKSQETMKRLQNTGSVDDAADAFMARWARPDADE